MTFVLRDYQEQAVAKTLESFGTHQAVLCVLATGTGKTVIASHVAKHFSDKGRILLLAHREELIFQGQKTLEQVTGSHPEIEMADSWANRSLWGRNIVCSTYQTQIAGRDGGRMNRFDPSDFVLVIADEAHHAVSASQRKVLDYYRQNPNLKVLGLTATPDRFDEEALGQVFQDVSFEFDILDGINGGWLVPIQQQAVYVEGLDFSNVRTTAGDLNGKDLAAVLEYEQNLHEMTTPILDLCGDKKTLIFTVTVAQAERMAEILNRHKPESAEFVTGETPKDYRRKLFEGYAAGQFQYLVNVGVATEGFDEPAIQYVVMGRPTKSRSLFAQMAGRGTRPLPGIVDGLPDAQARQAAIAASGKPFVSIVDFVGNAGRHKLMHATDVLGGKYSDEIVELATRNAEKSSKPVDIATELVKAEREIARRARMREEARARAKLKLRSQYTTSNINPFDVLDIVPCRVPRWYKGRPITSRQKNCLEKFGVNIPEDLSFVHASQLIDTLIKNRQAGKPSYKQARVLRRNGYNVDTMSFQDARQAIDELAANGWRRPRFMQKRAAV